MIDWRRLSGFVEELPFNGDLVLLAVPSAVAFALQLRRCAEPDTEHVVFLACFDADDRRWATTDEDDGEILWLEASAPEWWAPLAKPGAG